MSRSLLPLIFLILALGSSKELSAQSIIADSFKREGKSGQLLNGSKPEKGQETWDASENLIVIDGGDRGVAVSDSAFYIGKIKLPELDDKSVEIEASVRPDKQNDENPWIAIGFGNPGSTNNCWGGGVFLLLHKDGQWAGFFNPSPNKRETITRLGGGKAIDFDSEGFNTLKIRYNKKSNKVSMWINGAEVISENDLNQNGFQPDPAYGGFSGSGDQGFESACLNEFKVSLSK